MTNAHWKTTVIALCALMFVVLLGASIQASRIRSVLDNAHLMKDAWFLVTLIDAYIGFILFYLWIFWRESSWSSRTAWFVLIMTLGNMAATAYVVIQTCRLPTGAKPKELFSKP